MYSMAYSAALWPLLVLLFGVPGVRLGKCPKQCLCDQLQLTVACVNKNLTEVPPTIDEVNHMEMTEFKLIYFLEIHVTITMQ